MGVNNFWTRNRKQETDTTIVQLMVSASSIFSVMGTEAVREVGTPQKQLRRIDSVDDKGTKSRRKIEQT